MIIAEEWLQVWNEKLDHRTVLEEPWREVTQQPHWEGRTPAHWCISINKHTSIHLVGSLMSIKKSFSKRIPWISLYFKNYFWQVLGNSSSWYHGSQVEWHQTLLLLLFQKEVASLVAACREKCILSSVRGYCSWDSAVWRSQSHLWTSSLVQRLLFFVVWYFGNSVRHSCFSQ